MQVFLAGALGLLGIVLIVAGAKSNGTHLLSAVTGVTVGGKASGASGAAAHSPAPGAAVLPALGPTGPGSAGAVVSV